MKDEKNRENGCKIFCIYFENLESTYDFGNCYKKSKEIIQKIAELGGTKCYYNPHNLNNLCNSFSKISKVIQTNYILKLNA